MNTAHCGLAHWNAAVVNALKSRAIVDIDVVGMHGQTVWHEPQGTWFPLPEGNTLVRATLQLGNPQVLAALTDLPVISDFRSADMAVGGQGAPLSPSIDHLLFAERGKGVAVQNIGGISNVTILPKDKGPAEIWAFDTGPGNMIIDAVVGWGSEGTLRYDDEGRIASEARWTERCSPPDGRPVLCQKPPSRPDGRSMGRPSPASSSTRSGAGSWTMPIS